MKQYLRGDTQVYCVLLNINKVDKSRKNLHIIKTKLSEINKPTLDRSSSCDFNVSGLERDEYAMRFPSQVKQATQSD